MDYEKKYKDALERARKLRNGAVANDYTSDIEDYDTIFPELAESEDERIRKALIEHFTNYEVCLNDGTQSSNVLAWLEKQKEQQTAEWSKEDEDNLRRVTRIIEDNDSDWKELTEWLKSRRPTWKPSDEQMKALDFVLCYYAFLVNGVRKGLVSLYDDLKKQL